jgi:hypothetical protein
MIRALLSISGATARGGFNVGPIWRARVRSDLRDLRRRRFNHGRPADDGGGSTTVGPPTVGPPRPSAAAVQPRSVLLGGSTTVSFFYARIYMLTGENLAETSRRTGLDRRTVRRRIDRARLVRWLSGGK